jgi:hypothetical protein
MRRNWSSLSWPRTASVLRTSIASSDALDMRRKENIWSRRALPVHTDFQSLLWMRGSARFSAQAGAECCRLRVRTPRPRL